MKIKIKLRCLNMLCLSLLIITLSCKTKPEQETGLEAKEPVASFPKTSNYDDLITLFKECREFIQIIADRVAQLGEKFNFKEFYDQFHASGIIPISLIRWEMTGLDDQVRSLLPTQ